MQAAAAGQHQTYRAVPVRPCVGQMHRLTRTCAHLWPAGASVARSLCSNSSPPVQAVAAGSSRPRAACAAPEAPAAGWHQTAAAAPPRLAAWHVPEVPQGCWRAAATVGQSHCCCWCRLLAPPVAAAAPPAPPVPAPPASSPARRLTGGRRGSPAGGVERQQWSDEQQAQTWSGEQQTNKKCTVQHAGPLCGSAGGSTIAAHPPHLQFRR